MATVFEDTLRGIVGRPLCIWLLDGHGAWHGRIVSMNGDTLFLEESNSHKTVMIQINYITSVMIEEGE